MNKTFRQGQILKLIRSKRVLTQDDLAHQLKEAYGIQTTQVTLSRDIRELGLVKTHDGYRQVGLPSSGPDVATVVAEFLQDARVAQNLIVLRTSPGNANALAVALDKESWPEVVGTIAGDDTVLIICQDSRHAADVESKMRTILES